MGAEFPANCPKHGEARAHLAPFDKTPCLAPAESSRLGAVAGEAEWTNNSPWASSRASPGNTARRGSRCSHERFPLRGEGPLPCDQARGAAPGADSVWFGLWLIYELGPWEEDGFTVTRNFIVKDHAGAVVLSLGAAYHPALPGVGGVCRPLEIVLIVTVEGPGYSVESTE